MAQQAPAERPIIRAMDAVRYTEELSWPRFAQVAAICLVLSTQVLFQPGLLDNWSAAQAARGWFDYFAEIFLCGTLMWLAVTLVRPQQARNRWTGFALAAAALTAGSAAGSGIAILVLQPQGFYPTLPLFAGDALRWAIFGALVYFAHWHRKRGLLTREATEEATVARAILERQMIEAQLEVLQAQIEPHFLFNTLAHVKRLYVTRPDAAAEMLTNLRHYLRSALPRMREGGSTLGREVELAESYLAILRLRLGQRLEYSIDVAPELRTQPLPSMMLITLVENAIKHGIGPRQEGGTIAVRARTEQGRLEVEVADTGAGFHGGDGSGVGLANIRARLNGLYGDGASLSLLHNQPTGVIARIRIPE